MSSAKDLVVARFRSAIAAVLGLTFDDSKSQLLSEVLERRAEARAASPSSYVDALRAAPEAEIAALAQELTIGETYFFRASDQLDALFEVAIPERLAARSPERRLRILSAGCASGEEPYSIAMLARDRLDPSIDVTVRAIDVNPAALKRAAAATYSHWSLRETSADLRRRWFRAAGDQHVLDERARFVQFEARNIAEEDPAFWLPEIFDVVLCRNVLMYFSPSQMRAAIARIARSLAPGGFLFLGSAETLRGVSDEFRLRHANGAFFYERRAGDAEVRAEASEAPRHEPAPVPEIAADGAWVDAIARAAERVRAMTEPSALPAGASPRPESPLAAALDLLRHERYADAMETVRALPEHLSDEPDVLLLDAVLLLHTGKLEEAERVCRRLLARDDLDAGAHYVCALCREAAGDTRSAIDEDEAAIYLDPTFAMPRLHLGVLTRRRGDRRAAKDALEQAALLLGREDASRILMFGGGFTRDALVALCRAEIASCEEAP